MGFTLGRTWGPRTVKMRQQSDTTQQVRTNEPRWRSCITHAPAPQSESSGAGTEAQVVDRVSFAGIVLVSLRALALKGQGGKKCKQKRLRDD